MSQGSLLNITDTSSQDTELEKSSSKKYLWIVLLIALILTALFIIFQDSFARWSSADTSLSMQNVRIASVTEKDFVRDLSVQGRVVAAVSPRLYSPAQGTILKNKKQPIYPTLRLLPLSVRSVALIMPIPRMPSAKLILKRHKMTLKMLNWCTNMQYWMRI